LHLHTKFASPRLPLRATFSYCISGVTIFLDLSGYCNPAVVYLMAGITNDFERVKVRILRSVCRSQIRDAIEVGFNEEPKFDHQAVVMGKRSSRPLVAPRQTSPIGGERSSCESSPAEKGNDRYSAHTRAGLSFSPLMDWAVIPSCLCRRRCS
jgi:hypothetical protein